MKTSAIANEVEAGPRDSSRSRRTRAPVGSTKIAADGLADADYVVGRLEEAGATLLALPGSGWSTRMRHLLDRNRSNRAGSLRLADATNSAGGAVSGQNRPDGRGDGMDPPHSPGPLCTATYRRRAKPRSPNHRPPFVPLAAAWRCTGRGPQSRIKGGAMARAGPSSR